MTRSLAAAVVVVCALRAASAGDWPRIESVLPAAVGGDRPIVIEFFKPGCRYCERLSSEIWSDERIGALLGQVTKTRVDISTPSGGALAARMKVDLFPSVLLIDPTGRVLDRLDGLPEIAPARGFLERAAARRIAPLTDPIAWIEAGDFAADAGVLSLAVERYRLVMDDSRTPAQHAENTRLKCARTLERLGDRAGAAALVESFTAAPQPGGAVRPAIELLIRLRKALGDPEGEARAKAAFARLYPALTVPE